VLPLESVPNFSDGRDQATIDAIGDALAAHARLLDVHSDADHNRSVYTLVGSEDELGDALVAGVQTAIERIDLRAHDGAHPCIGAADVVPIVPLRPADLERARGFAHVDDRNAVLIARDGSGDQVDLADKLCHEPVRRLAVHLFRCADLLYDTEIHDAHPIAHR